MIYIHTYILRGALLTTILEPPGAPLTIICPKKSKKKKTRKNYQTQKPQHHLLKKNNISHNVLNAKVHDKEAQIIEKAGIPGNVTISTNMAGRGTDIKLGGIEKNNETLKTKAIESGGLLIIGTERHESRRIDNQLRGR